MSLTSELKERRKKRLGEATENMTSLTSELKERRRNRLAAASDSEDIAPVLTTTQKAEEEEDRTWFQKGSFDDGYQFGDVTKSILGTAGDVGVGAVKGLASLGEGLGDLAGYGIAGVADALGYDEYASRVRNNASENYIDLAFGGVQDSLDQYSLLGDKSDSVSEGLGQVAGIIATGGVAGMAGLSAAGATAVTTGLMGLSSMGSGMSEAYQGGATDEEAATYGLIKGLVDAGSELIFGGLGKTVKAVGLSKGLSSLDDIFAKKLSSKITNQVAKNFVEYGVKATAEGVEEVLSGIGSAVGKKLTYMDDTELTQLVKDENLLEQFVVGAVTSGIAQSGIVPGMKSGSLIEANKTGTDFITGLNQNEQAVVDQVYNDRVAEAGDISQKEKNKIYDEVLSDMEKGYISTDTIESVLGGDTYKTYKDTMDSEDAIAKEFDTLNQMKQGEMTGEQIDRRAELKAQLEEIKNNSNRSQLKTQLSDEVFGLVKDSKLAESYHERGKRSQAFAADVTQYNAKQQGTIQNAIDSGILNNTRRTHEFVDMIAKISADKGVLFDFTNNARLKDSGFAIDGKSVNGYVTKDGVTLNIDSAKSLNSVVGHEITHVLEGTELYTALQNAVTEYAKTKGDYHGRYDSLTKLYERIEGADVDAELTADLVGDYLFTDSDFVKNLSVTHRNVFQKIYDEIKYLCKVATAGSKEARELEKVKRAFDKAYKESGKGVTETKYSVGEQTRITNKLTGEELDGNTYDVLERLNQGEDISTDEIANLKEVREGAERAKEVARNFASRNHFENTPTNDIGTYLLNSDERNQLRNRILSDRLQEGSYSGIDENGREVYNGSVEKGKRLDIVIGLPASGKSSSIVNPLSQFYHSAVIDSDIIKQMLPEYQDGLGASLVHEESSQLNARLLKETMAMGNNVVLPIVGAKVSSVEKYIAIAHELGYSVNVHLNELPNGKAVGRMLTRYFETGRFIDPTYAAAYGNKPTEVYEQVKQRSDVNGYSRWNNDVPKGQRPSPTEISEGNRVYAGYSGAWRAGSGEVSGRVAGRTEKSETANKQIAPIRAPSTDGAFFDGKNPKYSLGEIPKEYGGWRVYGKDVALEADPVEETAPVREAVAENAPTAEDINAMFPDDLAPMEDDGQRLESLDDAGAPPISEIKTVRERLEVKLRNSQTELENNNRLREKSRQAYDDAIAALQAQYDGKKKKNTKVANDLLRRIERLERLKADTDADYEKRINDITARVDKERERLREGYSNSEARTMRTELHEQIVDNIRTEFSVKGFDFDKVLKNAKDLSTFATVDNTPQRVMDKTLGYKEGHILSDLTVNKVAQNETEGIKWLNSKIAEIKQISKQYHIKPGSKESKAAQMYAEGFYVAENNDIISYGDAELAKDFPNAKVRENIKGLAGDQRIRKIYDDTLTQINESRIRNAYPEIPRLDNYFLHFRAMDDTFSRLGLPFNPNDIRAKDLPTDLNGVTADLKPGQPYFASAMHRTGKRTSFDLLGGLERYLTSAKNQIYHIDDIQTLRALRNYIADTYGQANGLEGLDALTEKEAQERIKQVYGSHLSTFAKFLNEEANVLAGKTALMDRGLEGIIGRRGITFLNTVNRQVGSNMVGFNVSSSLTNILPVAQTFAKTNKFDFVKAFAQTVANKVGSIFGHTDGFAENSPVVIRRKGADSFYRTPFQKAGDAGYFLMSAVDNISTELIARAKFNELTRKGMDEQQAHFETDKWVSRLMGDRSFGQQPQLYNSKMLGLVTKFQLEVRNQLDSQFYDTIQETRASNEHIQNGLLRNAKTAAKVASTFVQLAAVQHLFGKAFESVAGYNPAFDIVEVIIKAFGWDDDEESEDTVLDNIEEGFLTLLEDLPYTSTFTGGRIPISSALPISELITGEDKYGDKSRLETLREIAPYYILPSGYGQIKKTYQGLSMFSDDHPVAGSYTDSGNLRFPVEETPANIAQAAIFGQWASENAGDYFDNDYAPLNEKQIDEYTSLGLSYDEYWAYRNDMSEIGKRADVEGASDEDVLKSKYINSVNSKLSDIRAERQEVMDDAELTDEEKETRIRELDEQLDDLANERYNSYENVSISEFTSHGISFGKYANVGNKYFKKDDEGEWVKLNDDQTAMFLATKDAGDSYYATDGENHYRWYVPGEDAENKEPGWEKLTDKQVVRQRIVTNWLDITPEEYWSNKEEYDYAYDSPESYAVAKSVGGYEAYKEYASELDDIKADKDANGKSINGSRKEKVLDWLDEQDMEYGEKLILFKSAYNADDTYNYEIIDYLNSRYDISYAEMETILKELGFTVDSEGNIYWD